MPPLTANKCIANLGPATLLQAGPIIPAFITIPDVVAKARGGTRPVIKVNALLDTGARSTCITTKVVHHLGLKSIGNCISGGAYGPPQQCNLYSISFTFEGSSFQVSGIQVSDADLHGAPFDMLVGRDVLAACHLTYDGYTGQFTLEVPSPASPDHPDKTAKKRADKHRVEADKRKDKNRKRAKLAKKAKAKNR